LVTGQTLALCLSNSNAQSSSFTSGFESDEIVFGAQVVENFYFAYDVKENRVALANKYVPDGYDNSKIIFWSFY
jgi:hypothetical protein